MATTQSQSSLSRNDALVMHIVKQLCINVTGQSSGNYERDLSPVFLRSMDKRQQVEVS